MDKRAYKEDSFPTDYLRDPDLSCTDPKLIWELYMGDYDGKEENRSSICLIKKKFAPIATSFSGSDENLKCRRKKRRKKRSNLDHEVDIASTINCSANSLDNINCISSNGDSNIGHNDNCNRVFGTPSSNTNEILDREGGKKQRKKQRRNKSVKRRLMRESIQAVADATYATMATIINSNNSYIKSITSGANKCGSSSNELSRNLSSDQYTVRYTEEKPQTNKKSYSSSQIKRGRERGPYPHIRVGSDGCSILSQKDTEFGLNCEHVTLISDYTSIQVSDVISYHTLDLCEITFQPVISSSIYKCTVLDRIHPSTVKGVKGSIIGQCGRFRVVGVPPDSSEERESEYWVSWNDIAEIILVSKSQHTRSNTTCLPATPQSDIVWNLENQNMIRGGEVERGDDEEFSFRVADSRSSSSSFRHNGKQGTVPVVRVEKISPTVGLVADSVQKIKLKAKKRRKRTTSFTPTMGSITDYTANEFAMDDLNLNQSKVTLTENSYADSGFGSGFGSLIIGSTVPADLIGHSGTASSSSQQLGYHHDIQFEACGEVSFAEMEEIVIEANPFGILIEQPPLHQSDESGDRDGYKDRDGEIDGDRDEIVTSASFSFADFFEDILMKRRSQIEIDE